VNNRDIGAHPDSLQASLADELSRYAADEGLRLEGPMSVAIETSDETPPGTVMFHVEVVPGAPTPWAKLVSREETHQVGRNRTLLGRDPEADLVLAHDDISRRHALIWREQGSAWIRDLGSSNGTSVSGEEVGYAPTRLSHGSVVGLAGHEYRFLEG
ncbi:MAG: FHA domain-containing protein, partial [Acidimicrobiia bacterium]